MSTHKWINAVCLAGIILALLVTILFMNGASLGLETPEGGMGYEQRLFTQDRVHTIDLQVGDWEGFLETCTNEEYTQCTAVIDGEAFANIGIRAKGNTSLSTIASMDSNRYSFKLEFDQYDQTKSYHGLDKLSLNNLIQDNTLMKDYLTYQWMREMGAAAPLCSYVYITVNGEDWGLYLAVEAIEESFLLKNYGSDYGELYKPDAVGNGGGRGNGKDFDMEQWNRENNREEQQTSFQQKEQQGSLPSGEALKEALEAQGIPEDGLGDVDWETVTFEELSQALSQLPEMDVQALMGAIMGGRNPEDMNSKGSADVKLQYVDDNPDSYSNIFNNAKTDVTQEDKARLVEALRKLSSREDLESTLDIDSVLRYFVVHTFVCNEDSYTGSMIHNYYLYEQQGQLAMLPWDYNLAFGGLQSGNASTVVNSSIDNPMNGDGSDRPMFSWIDFDEAYTMRYHQLYQEFLDMLQADPDVVSRTAELIAPYVEKDPTKFCGMEEFKAGTAALEAFILLRTESASQQLEGQQGMVDAAELNLSDMGGIHQGKGDMERPEQARPNSGETDEESERPARPGQMGGMQPPEGGRPGNGDFQNFDGMGPLGGGFQPEQRPEVQPQSPGGDEMIPQRDPMPLLLTLVCMVVLAAGILLVRKFKRRK